MSVLLLLVGLALLIGGAEFLVRGASALARSCGISELIVGLTVVAFGTSTPELAVNLSASLTSKGDLVFGNVVGSNICNIGLILGICALIRPLTTQAIIIKREIPMMLLASAATVVMSLDATIDGQASAIVGRSDGIIMLLLFGVFLHYLTAESLTQRAEANIDSTEAKPNIGIAIAHAVGGLIALVVGGKLAVDAAVDMATALGVSEVVIGLFLLAVGTSLPELAVSASAAWKGKTDIAVGNIVGSNIFNLLFILGVSATIKPLPIPRGGTIDLIVMTAFALVLLPMAMTQRRIVRGEGIVLLLGYACYIAWRALA